MENEELEKLTGTVELLTYYDENTGFAIMEVNTGEEAAVVVGHLAAPAEGIRIECEGTWHMHPSYGREFKAATVRQVMPVEAEDILRYLSSGIIRGVREATATKIVEMFGADTFDVLENEPERLAEIKGITLKKARDISREFKAQFAARETIIGLTALGLTNNEAIKTYGLFKSDALDIVKENPYALIGAVSTVTFDRADEIAAKLDEAPSYDYRAQAAVVHIVSHNLGNGHTCVPRRKVLAPAKELLGCNDDYAEIAIDNALDARMLVQDTLKGKEFLFMPDIYEAEKRIAERIAVMTAFPPIENVVFDTEIGAFEAVNNIELDERQREAVAIAVRKGLLILTGGPGTGKTTTVKAIISMMKARGFKVALAAPTGRAAQRMEELTGYEAKTIHRLLEVEFKDDSETSRFVHNATNLLDYDAIILDELSMVDVTLFAAFLDAMPLKCRLIMVGDNDQLPPVGAGNVLGDLIESGVIPVVTLDKVFRQAMQSRIVTNAHLVVSGKMPVIDNAPESDFFLLRENSKFNAPGKILRLVTQRLPVSYGYDVMSDIQVLCPSRVGECGSQNLNAMLQKALNPPARGKNELRYKGYILREGDRVMQVKNNYDVPWFRGTESGAGVFNGDIGVLKHINLTDNAITVMFDDKEALYTLDSARELELAYAMTVHKSQGSEFTAVVMPVLGVPEKLAYRNLFYTALTRAKKLLVIVGNEGAIRAMVKNDDKARRFSALKYFIEKECETI